MIDADVELRGRRIVEAMLRDDDSGIESALYVRSSDSTNSLAMSEIRRGNLRSGALPRLVLVDQQTAGRGRLGRTWHSDAGTLTFSLIIDASDSSEAMPLAVGVSVAQTLEFEFAPIRIQLKWPNDLLIGGSKLGGILCESVQDTRSEPNTRKHLVIGVGINVASAPDLETTSGHSTISLSQQVGRTVHRFDLLPSLLKGLQHTVTQSTNDPAAIMKEFRSRCSLTGQPIRYIDQGGPCVGDCLGIDDAGSLKVRTSEGVHILNSGEVQHIRNAS